MDIHNKYSEEELKEMVELLNQQLISIEDSYGIRTNQTIEDDLDISALFDNTRNSIKPGHEVSSVLADRINNIGNN